MNKIEFGETVQRQDIPARLDYARSCDVMNPCRTRLLEE